MIREIKNAKIIILGGGFLCKELLVSFLSNIFADSPPKILGIISSDVMGVGIVFARSMNIFICNNYKEIINRDKVDFIIETINYDFGISQLEPFKILAGVNIISLPEAISLVDSIKVEEIAQRIVNQLTDDEINSSIIDKFKEYSKEIKEIITKKNRRSYELNEHKKVLSYIIQGSTIPTFVIDKNHLVTHWNGALEKLTGYKYSQMIGSRKQWVPFWERPRPTMADIILDQINEYEIENFYSGKWKRSDLVDGGYEAELFFSNMGKDGRWLFFTAAPIKSSDGSVIGAIETLWDTTEKKKIEEERRQYTFKIKEKERALEQIIQGSTVPTFVINKEHIITHWNKALEELTGFKSVDMLKTDKHWKPFSKKKQPIMADLILKRIKTTIIEKPIYSPNWRKSNLIEGGYESEDFFNEMGKNGKWLFSTAAPIKSSYNSIVGVIQTFWDISLAKQAEDERKRYTEELATLCSIYTVLNVPAPLEERIQNAINKIRKFVNASKLCLYVSDNKGNFNPQYFSSCVSETEIIDTKVDVDVINKVVKTNKIMITDSRIETNCNSKKVTAYVPIKFKVQYSFGVMQIIKDKGVFCSNDLYLLDLISNRVGVMIENSFLQEELEKKTKFQSKLIKSSNDGIIAINKKWETVIFNPAAEKIFGYSANYFLDGNDVRDFLPQKAINIFKKDVFNFSREEESSPWCDMEIISKKNERIPVRFSGSILKAKNKVIGTVAFFQDLREIKRLEKELLQSEKLAVIGQTVAGMAHCIKNILHGFKGGRYLMDVGTNKNNIDKIKNGWGMIQRNIDRTSDLVLDLLTYSKEREPEIKSCYPEKIIDDIYDLFFDVALKNKIKFIKMYSNQEKKAFLDSKIVHRCMMNLVTNAIDACLFDDQTNKEHHVIFKINMCLNKIVEFIVEDNGCGMTESIRKKLFSSVFSTKGVKGTGLGLLVTSKLVDECDGSIEVMSKNGKGTTFTIRLPSKDSVGNEPNKI